MNKVKVGILGAGGIAKVHVGNLLEDERVEITAIGDIFQNKAEVLAHTVGLDVKIVETIDDLLKSGVDAVYVTTPNTTHVEPVLTCLENNIHVFCEKPMATSLDDAQRIKEAAAKSKAIYNLGMNRRYAFVYKKIKSLIDSKEFVPVSAMIKMNRGELLNPAWTSDPTKTGGFLYETPFHLFDLCRYLFGEIESLQCEATQAISVSEIDNFAILLKFKSGVVATFITYAHAGWGIPFEKVEVYGKYQTFFTEELERVTYSPGLQKRISIEDYSQISFEEKWGYVEEDQLFIDAIINGSKPPVDAEDGFLSTKVTEAIYESAKTGKKIRF